MKRIIAAAMAATLATAANAQECIAIKDGYLTHKGNVVEPGVNAWGHNYQARKFSGQYCDNYYDAAWCQQYNNTFVEMKWNDVWLSNKDCDADGNLDRHTGFETYRGSGARLYQRQTMVHPDDTVDTYQSVIKAAPEEAVEVTIEGERYFMLMGKKPEVLGPVIWNQFYVEWQQWHSTGDHERRHYKVDVELQP